MEIVINVSDVLPQVQMVANIISNKNVIPSLNFIHFMVNKDGEIVVMGSNGETWVSSLVVADKTNLEGRDEMTFCMEGDVLLQSLRSLSNKTIEMVFDESEKMVTCGYQSGVFKLPYYDAGEYPMPVDVDGVEVDVKVESLAYGIQKVKIATAQETLRPQLNGIHIDITQGMMACVATDSHRLALYKDHTIAYDGMPLDMNLPLSAMQVVADSCAKNLPNGGDVRMLVGEINVAFQFGDETKVVTRKLEGKYPDYNRVIPNGGSETCVLMKQPTMEALKRTMIMGSQSVGLVVLDFDETNKDVFTMSAEDVDFSRSAKEDVPCKDYQGTTMKVGFKGVFILGALGMFDEEDLLLTMNGATKAATITPKGGERDLLFLVMPAVVQ